jgi:hypothetical protein
MQEHGVDGQGIGADPADPGDDLGDPDVLEHEPGRPGIGGFQRHVILGVSRHDDHMGSRPQAHDAGHGVDTAAVREADVHEDDVGFFGCHHLECPADRRRDPDGLDSVLEAEGEEQRLGERG